MELARRGSGSDRGWAWEGEPGGSLGLSSLPFSRMELRPYQWEVIMPALEGRISSYGCPQAGKTQGSCLCGQEAFRDSWVGPRWLCGQQGECHHPSPHCGFSIPQVASQEPPELQSGCDHLQFPCLFTHSRSQLCAEGFTWLTPHPPDPHLASSPVSFSTSRCTW